MSSFNKVILMGNLTRDPELKYTPSNMAVVRIGIAVNHRFKSKDGEWKDEATFVDCEAWGTTAENIQKFFNKGKPILVEGRLKLDQWEAGGAKKSKLKVVVERFEFVGGKDGASRESGVPSQVLSGRASAFDAEDDIGF